MSRTAEVISGVEAVKAEAGHAREVGSAALERTGLLIEQAAAHGWFGLVRSMRGVREALEQTLADLDAAGGFADQTLAVLGAVTDQTSHDEVAEHLGTALASQDQIRTAIEATGAAAAHARQACERAGSPEQVMRMLHNMTDAVGTASQRLDAVKTLTKAEQEHAHAWGTGVAGPLAPANPPPAPPASATGPPGVITRPTGPAGGTPTGRPTTIRPQEDADVTRSLHRENDAAVILAQRGYLVHQNPTPQQIADARTKTGDSGDPGAEPDYLLEGRVFDCYAPAAGKKVRNMWDEVGRKVKRGQTQRVVINLQEWGGDLGAVRKQFRDWPAPGLKEVKAITADGQVHEVWHAGEAR